MLFFYFLPLLPENPAARDSFVASHSQDVACLYSTLNLCCFGCTVIYRTGFEEHLLWRDSGATQMVGEKELEMNEVKQQRRQGAGDTVVSHCFVWSHQPGMLKWKGTRSSWALEGDGNWKCRGPIQGLLIDSWIKYSFLISSARVELFIYYWLRRRASGAMGFLPGRNLDILVFSLLYHAAEEPRLYLVPSPMSPAAVSQRGIRQTEASSHPFHLTSLLLFFFLYVLVLFSYLPIYLPCQIAASFCRDLMILCFTGQHPHQICKVHCTFSFLTPCFFEVS